MILPNEENRIFSHPKALCSGNERSLLDVFRPKYGKGLIVDKQN